jgi:hypothetical protein
MSLYYTVSYTICDESESYFKYNDAVVHFDVDDNKTCGDHAQNQEE